MNISIQSLSKHFKKQGKIQVLQELSFDIESGGISAIEGASGEGKSTFLYIVGTLDEPSTGKILYDGKEILQMNQNQRAKFRAKNLGFIFQHHYLLPDFTVLENTMMPLLIRRENRSSAQKESKKILDMVGLGDRLSHYPDEISGGEMARAGVARALAGNKSLILADEPTGNLDRKNVRMLRDLIWELHEKMKFTLVIVTHDRELARSAPKRYTLSEGRLHERNPLQKEEKERKEKKRES